MKRIIVCIIFCSKMVSAQIVHSIVGDGTTGYSGDGGPATAAAIYNPGGIAYDTSSNLYVSEFRNHTIRKVSTTGIITTICGNGVSGFSGDGGPASAAQLSGPVKIAIDRGGNLYITDKQNHRIRKISVSGIITTIAGNGVLGYAGDGGVATAAKLNFPTGLDVDTSGNLYIADEGNLVVRKVTPGGTITTFAGTGISGSSGDGGQASAARFRGTHSVNVDAIGNIFITDPVSNNVRKVSPSGIISTFAGNGTAGFGGDGGMANVAMLNNPAGVTFDTTGNVYIADMFNERIRKVSSSGIITTIAGNGLMGYSGDGGAATAATFHWPTEITIDRLGNLLLTDDINNRVRVITTCDFGFNLQPSNDTVFAGNTAKYWVTTTMPFATYQWQQNAGSGYVNLANAWPYSGVTTDTLTIHNASLFIDITYYRCVITNGTLCSDTSAPAVLHVIGTTDVTKQFADRISIYPNPTSGLIRIELPMQNMNGTISLIDQLGQVAIERSIDSNSITIDLSGVAPGMYFMKIQSKGQVVYKKIFKQ